MNQYWSDLIISELLSKGIDYFCIAPGSRSTPLTLAAENHPKAKTHIHFDERGLGFHALGFAKATQNPATIIVTSGTAVGNLLPSIMEAYHSNTPMIILTADRPFELKDCGANQATEQTYIFKPWVRWQCEFSLPEKTIPDSVVRSKIAYAAAQAKQLGPVHINLPFREPLFSQEHQMLSPSREASYFLPKPTLQPQDFETLARKIQQYPKSVVLIGNNISPDQTKQITDFAKKNNFPIIADLFSKPYCANHIQYHDLIEKPQPDAIIHFGTPLISKKILQWISKTPPKMYCQICSSEKHVDPTHLVTDRAFCTPSDFCQNVDCSFQNISWLNEWQKMQNNLEEQIDAFFSVQTDLAEPTFFHRFSQYLPNCKALFIGNSMPIRDANAFLSFKNPIFANRGMSGIDGNIATAIGLAQGLRTPLTAIVGDLTFLADLNSLAQLKNCEFPVQFVVFNNSGGSIFSHLPVQKSKHFEKCFQTKHSLHFKDIASQFNLPYHRVEKLEDLRQDFSKRSLIELITCAKKNSSIHQQLKELNCHVIYS